MQKKTQRPIVIVKQETLHKRRCGVVYIKTTEKLKKKGLGRCIIDNIVTQPWRHFQTVSI